jgi:hypothetical protein
MSNWIDIDSAAVKTGKTTVFLTKMQAKAAALGEADPLPAMIDDVTAQLRATVSTGNTLDADTAKIPNSLKGLALRMVMRRIKDYLEYPLSADELKQATDDSSYLNRIVDSKIQFETPDTPGGSGEMQSGAAIMMGTAVKDPHRVTTRERLNRL